MYVDVSAATFLWLLKSSGFQMPSVSKFQWFSNSSGFQIPVVSKFQWFPNSNGFLNPVVMTLNITNLFYTSGSGLQTSVLVDLVSTCLPGPLREYEMVYPASASARLTHGDAGGLSN